MSDKWPGIQPVPWATGAHRVVSGITFVCLYKWSLSLALRCWVFFFFSLYCLSLQWRHNDLDTPFGETVKKIHQESNNKLTHMHSMLFFFLGIFDVNLALHTRTEASDVFLLQSISLEWVKHKVSPMVYSLVQKYPPVIVWWWWWWYVAGSTSNNITSYWTPACLSLTVKWEM